MGRTNKTYRNHLDKFIENLKPFKKALRKRNKKHLEKLFAKAHQHASAAAYLNSPKPGTPAILSMLLGLQKEVDKLDSRLEKIEQEVN